MLSNGNMISFKILLVLGASVFQISWATVTTIQEKDGVISSPDSPFNYKDGEDIRYRLDAPDDHVISLKFIDLIKDGTTDLIKVLQILDGSNILTVNENTSTPFYIISKTSQVEIVIPSKYNDATEDELKIVYKMHRIPPACIAENEQQNLFEPCDTLDRASTQCVQGCKQNQTLVEYSKQSCVIADFLPFTCIDEGLVKKCEKNSNIDCPYNDEELFAYYETIDWIVNGKKKKNELQSATHSVHKRSTSCRRFCKRKRKGFIYRFTMPDSCSNLARYSVFAAKRCNLCRKYACKYGHIYSKSKKPLLITLKKPSVNTKLLPKLPKY